MLEFEAATVTYLSDVKKPITLKTLAETDPDVRGFLRTIRDTGLRAKAVELLARELRSQKKY